MGKGDAPPFLVEAFDRRENFLSHAKTLLGVRDAGNGDVLNGQYGHDAAADIDEVG